MSVRTGSGPAPARAGADAGAIAVASTDIAPVLHGARPWRAVAAQSLRSPHGTVANDAVARFVAAIVRCRARFVDKSMRGLCATVVCLSIASSTLAAC